MFYKELLLRIQTEDQSTLNQIMLEHVIKISIKEWSQQTYSKPRRWLLWQLGNPSLDSFNENADIIESERTGIYPGFSSLTLSSPEILSWNKRYERLKAALSLKRHEALMFCL